MKESELPSYAELFDFYKRYSDDTHTLTDYRKIPSETILEAREYFENFDKVINVRSVIMKIAAEKVEYNNNVFLFAEQMYDYIMQGKVPESVKPEGKPQGYFIRKDVDENIYVNFNKGIAPSED